jgi:hypothetical protein
MHQTFVFLSHTCLNITHLGLKTIKVQNFENYLPGGNYELSHSNVSTSFPERLMKQEKTTDPPLKIN